MRMWRACGIAGLLLGAVAAAAQAVIEQKPIEFAAGATSATVQGKIRGDGITDYQLGAKARQSVVVAFDPSNPSAYFNVLPPGSQTALFVGSVSGNRFEGQLPADGVYTIRVYLMRNAARRGESADYTLEVSLGKAGGFDRTLALQEIQFHVTATQDGKRSTLRIVPSGLEIDNAPIERTVDGNVTNAEVADLDVDGSPEIYVYVVSPDARSRGSLVAYAANKRKSLSEIYLTPLNEAVAQGYVGFDEFAVVESVLVRRFPVYTGNDARATPAGRTRQIQYRLAPGEAGWVLGVDKVLEY